MDPPEFLIQNLVYITRQSLSLRNIAPHHWRTAHGWGSGRLRLEFLHVDDMADACVFLMERGLSEGICNIGAGEDVTIRELAETIQRVVGFEGDLVFDASKPDGTPRKLLDVSRLRELGWTARIRLEAGIRTTYESFLPPCGGGSRWGDVDPRHRA